MRVQNPDIALLINSVFRGCPRSHPDHPQNAMDNAHAWFAAWVSYRLTEELCVEPLGEHDEPREWLLSIIEESPLAIAFLGMCNADCP